MTTPLTPPTFGDKYNVGLTDLGSGYAAGITSAGQSIAGAIGAVMGGINAKTGEAQEGVLGQKKSSEDYLTALHMHGALTDEEYAKAMSSGLGAQQKIAGQFSADFNTKMQLQLQNENAMRLAQYNQAQEMARTRLTTSSSIEQQKIASAPKPVPIKEEDQTVLKPTPIPQSPLFNPPPTYSLFPK